MLVLKHILLLFFELYAFIILIFYSCFLNVSLYFRTISCICVLFERVMGMDNFLLIYIGLSINSWKQNWMFRHTLICVCHPFRRVSSSCNIVQQFVIFCIFSTLQFYYLNELEMNIAMIVFWKPKTGAITNTRYLNRNVGLKCKTQFREIQKSWLSRIGFVVLLQNVILSHFFYTMGIGKHCNKN